MERILFDAKSHNNLKTKRKEKILKIFLIPLSCIFLSLSPSPLPVIVLFLSFTKFTIQNLNKIPNLKITIIIKIERERD